MFTAKSVIVFWGGQVNLWTVNDVVDRYYWLHENVACQAKAYWYDLHDILDNNQVAIYYFYSTRCEDDLIQYNLMKGISNVVFVPMDSDSHGECVDDEARVYICKNAFKESFYNRMLEYGLKMQQGMVLSPKNISRWIVRDEQA